MFFVLRNVVPRQGTETLSTIATIDQSTIEKCSSPTGDGNFLIVFNAQLFQIEKCSSPTGDGNMIFSISESERFTD